MKNIRLFIALAFLSTLCSTASALQVFDYVFSGVSGTFYQTGPFYGTVKLQLADGGDGTYQDDTLISLDFISSLTFLSSSVERDFHITGATRAQVGVGPPSIFPAAVVRIVDGQVSFNVLFSQDFDGSRFGISGLEVFFQAYYPSTPVSGQASLVLTSPVPEPETWAFLLMAFPLLRSRLLRSHIVRRD